MINHSRRILLKLAVLAGFSFSPLLRVARAIIHGNIGNSQESRSPLPLGVEDDDYSHVYHAKNGSSEKNLTKAFKPMWFRKPVDRWITGTILKASDLFTVTTEETKRLYIEQFPGVSDKIYTVYNGFEHNLLDDIEEQEKFSKFTIIYTGNFYYDIEFDYFFEGLGLLKKEGTINADNFQFLFYGGSLERIQYAMMRYDVSDLVRIKSRIPYYEIFKEIKRSHLHLLRILQPMISTKLFEGIALNIPFLATLPAGEVERIVRKYSQASFIITDNLPKTVERCVNKAMIRYRENRIEANFVKDFLVINSRKAQSQKFIELMRGCYSCHLSVKPLE